MADGIYIDFSDLLKTEKLLPSVLEKIKDDVDEILSANALEIGNIEKTCSKRRIQACTKYHSKRFGFSRKGNKCRCFLCRLY